MVVFSSSGMFINQGFIPVRIRCQSLVSLVTIHPTAMWIGCC
jgi:hypothetical protein